LALSASGFSPAPKLEKGHRFLEHSARRAIIQLGVWMFDHCQPPPALQPGFAQQKIALHHHPAELIVKFGHLTLAQLIARSQMISEHPGHRVHQRLLLGVDLMGMDSEASGEFRHRCLLAQRCECDFGLESGIVFASTC
jgi:hypothetical protein